MRSSTDASGLRGCGASPSLQEARHTLEAAVADAVHHVEEGKVKGDELVREAAAPRGDEEGEGEVGEVADRLACARTEERGEGEGEWEGPARCMRACTCACVHSSVTHRAGARCPRWPPSQSRGGGGSATHGRRAARAGSGGRRSRRARRRGSARRRGRRPRAQRAGRRGPVTVLGGMRVRRQERRELLEAGESA